MQPEFPPAFVMDDATRVVFASEGDVYCCEMLRLGQPCGNESDVIMINEHKGSALNAIAICRACAEEHGLTGEETTAYWREKQREWGVR